MFSLVWPRNWNEWLPVIADVESGGNPIAKSYLGEAMGRGKYQVSEVCLFYFKKENPKWSFLTPGMLYNESICEMVALWALNWLEKHWGENNIYLILSSYNTGYMGTTINGVNWVHVNKILTNKLCPEPFRIKK